MITVKDYSDELLLNRWNEQRELLRDLGELIDNSDYRGKYYQERLEDHARHKGYLEDFRAEMRARGMFAEDGSLKPEFRKLII